MITIDPRDARPIYVQIIQQVKMLMASGVKQPGEQLPSIRELSVRLAVNPNTVLKAYAELEREGLVATKRGQGYFAASGDGANESHRLEMFRTWCRPVVANGLQVGLSLHQMTQILKEEHVAASQDILNDKEGEK